MVDPKDISRISLFEGLNDAERISIANVMTGDTFSEGHVVYRENEVGCSCVYIIKRGKVDVLKMSTDGDPLTLAVLKEGNFFGEFSFFDHKPHSASTVVSAPDTVVLSLQRPDFDQVAEKYPMIGYKVLINIVQEISAVIRRMNASYVDMAGYMFGRARR
ncbi:MAG TPA: cyclic nucleotide-binding domain-containing protein [Nitrospirota bacterium]|jgi:CRP-like cAMP-binding protein|nr:cyclic nucleotide-binding domain-containing protein [Nitrospirota bacterium]